MKVSVSSLRKRCHSLSLPRTLDLRDLEQEIILRGSSFCHTGHTLLILTTTECSSSSAPSPAEPHLLSRSPPLKTLQWSGAREEPPAPLVSGRLRQEDQKIEASLRGTASLNSCRQAGSIPHHHKRSFPSGVLSSHA